MIEQCVDEAVPVLVTTELRRDAIAIIALYECEGDVAEIATAELDRLEASQFVIVDLSRLTELGPGARKVLKQVHAWLPVGAELAVAASAPDVVEALQASALGRSLPRHVSVEDAVVDARDRRGEPVAARPLAGPGLRMVEAETRYSADWL